MGFCASKLPSPQPAMASSGTDDRPFARTGGIMPCIYINHGGGPMPLLGQQPAIADFLGSYLATQPQQPSAIIVATAHWETDTTSVSSGERHELLFDYGGFPPETYKYTYPAPGSPALAS